MDLAETFSLLREAAEFEEPLARAYRLVGRVDVKDVEELDGLRRRIIALSTRSTLSPTEALDVLRERGDDR